MLGLLNCFSTSDFPTIGRFDCESLTDQSRMELIFLDAKVVTLFQSNGNFYDIAQWKGVEMDSDGYITTFNSASIVFSIYTHALLAGGRVNIDFLPSTIVSWSLCNMNLEGTITTGSLPRGLRTLELNHNALSGTLDVSGLPLEIECIGLEGNNLIGTLDLSRLPSSVQLFDVCENRFSGSLDLSMLPDSLDYFAVGVNEFSGTIDLKSLPAKLEEMDLSENLIQQEVLVIGEIPESLHTLTLTHLDIRSIVDLDGNKVENPIIKV